ncbi:hypothetical protein HanPI659440_Chr03g0117201 [Helianthus annuus]|nr:hypothetical protein HanPI659440_Chr03g0117201 [Helianthus annuus]
MCLRIEGNAGMRTSDSCRIEAELGSRTRNKGIREDSRMNQSLCCRMLYDF